MGASSCLGGAPSTPGTVASAAQIATDRHTSSRRGIQYAAAFRPYRGRLWNTGSSAGACHRAAQSADPVADDDDGSAHFLPSPLVGEGGAQSAPDEGSLSAETDPSPVFASRSHPLPQGERVDRAPSASIQNFKQPRRFSCRAPSLRAKRSNPSCTKEVRVDCFAALAMTVRHNSAISPRISARVLASTSGPRSAEGAGNAGRSMRPQPRV